MFRFTQWMPASHDWTRWMRWFREQAIIAEVVRCNDPGYAGEQHDCRFTDHTAIFREGEEVIAPETLEQRRYVALRLKREASDERDG